jgi:hypothetical protein
VSLTSFLELNADVRKRFLGHFTKPAFRTKAPLLAPPLTQHYGLSGTAFDYLLRFYIQKLNLCSETSDWVAEAAFEKLREISSLRTREIASRLFEQAKDRHSRFLRSSRQKPPRDLIESAIYLARLDVLFRAGILDPYLFNRAPKALVNDLESMLVLVKRGHFRAKKRCLLNPTFGLASDLVGGADGDLVIDDTLIDVKTTKHLIFDREIFNQLAGYYVLSCIGGIGDRARARVSHLAVYYARYGLFHRIPVAKCFSAETMEAFLRWFTNRARREYPQDES